MLLVSKCAIFIGLVFTLPCVVYGRQYGTPGKTLYVDEEKQAGGKLTVINRATVQGPDSHLARRKREATTLDSPGIQKNISTWTTHLNDSHQQLMVHWVGEGSNVIICLARDSSPRNKGGVSPSALFISYDYGKNFTNKTESFRLGDTPDNGYAQLDKFFNHPKYPEFCVFVDSTNQKLYYTSDNGNTIHRSDLNFHPSELAFDEEFPDKYVVLDKVDTNRKLYLTLDGGKTFKMIQSFVKTFVWSSGPGVPKVFYVERWKPDGTSTVFSASDPRDLAKATVLFEEAKDFQIKGDYMFATKQSKEANSLHLYISHQRGPFYKAEFGTELDLRKFHIADVTDKRIFVSVMHTDTLANLYVSEIGNNFTQYNFVLSLDQILSYFPDGNWKDSWLEDVTEDSFTDLYRVEGVKGVYIASYVDPRATGSIGPEHLFSVITFDHGVTWAPIRPPTEDENGKPLNCPYGSSCSLHLCQKFSQLYPVTRSASIMSSKSAPGIIMATGVLGKSLKGIPGVYLSRDAGLTWKRILKDYYFFNYGDHGGVLVAVKYFKSRGETRRILYSTNEGIDWNSYQFNAEDLRIYGLMTEPGENTTTFTMFGSANDHHQWIIITIDLRNTFPRNCTQDDFKFWSPSPPNSSVSCVLGTRNTFQRRLAHTNCYHGVDFERGVTKEVCECSRRDFECDFGFMLSGNDCIRNKTAKYDPYTIPGGCRPGHYYQRTKGYRKIDGDVCTISGYMSYVADMVPCPLQQPQEFLLVALRDRIARIDLYDNSTIFPVEFQKNVVAIEADIKNNCIYWADIEMDKISRQCFNESTPQEVIVDTDLASIEGMALDWISNVLFFVDGLRKKIEAVRTDLTSQGRMRVTILDEAHLSKPRGIAVHPRAGYLFWTDWDRNNPSVSRSHLDGTEVTRLFSKPIVQWPNGITIDHMSERIYWVDAMEDYIASSDLNGKFFKRILGNNEKVSHPFAVAVLKDKIFWDDWKERSIFSADKDTGMDIISIQDSLISFIGLMDVKAFAHFTQHGSNACSYKNTSCDTMCLGGPGNTFTCLCPEGFKMTNGKCLCPNGLEPSANMTCPKKPGGTCDANEFTCKNGQCIMWVWRCDGNNDCGDLSDEVGCHCAPPMVTCDSNRCYLPSWKCDGDMDCVDMSDEQDCGSHNCTENQFQCANGHCIEKRWLCDGDNDCKDGSDERNCSIVSKRPLMNCQNGFACGNDSELCVPTSWVCDGEHDCPSGDDEKEERCKNSTCAPYMFRCPNGKCIFKSWVCDGENDCSDVEASDEKNCTNVGHSKLLPNPSTPLSPNFPVNGTCLDWMFKCKNGNCLPDWWRCDSIDDCGDHSDEIGCGLVLPETKNISPEVTTARHKCAKNQFTCAPGVCIPLTWVCDGVNDCTQGSDEKDCVSRAPAAPPCAADATPCADGGGCVDDARLCDGVYDCTDRSDEAMCPTKTKHKIVTECSAGEFSCDDGSDCIPISYLCDGSQNCWDASDEANCSAAGTDTHMYQFLSIGVDQSSINSTSFLISCWMAQQKMVQYSFLPSISKVGDNAWNNMTWTNDSIYRFTNLEPYTNYNVTFYIRDSRSNITYASNKYVNTTTGEGVPSPPGNLSIHQFIGSRLQVTFDAPSQPRGDILFYTLFYSPPTPPMQKVIPAYNKTISIVIHSYFKPNVNYSFWVQATNNVYSSNTTEILYMTFEEVGDIDDINNVRMSRPTNDSVRLEWHRIPDVDGYKIQLDLPYAYAKREPIVTQDNFVTITDLPPGCDMHIEIRAFKSHFYSDPFTVPLKTEGIPHEIIAPDLYILAEENTVHLNWTRPMSLRYNGKNLTYDVHYSNIIRRTNPGEVSNDTRIITNATEVTIRDLHACELYRFSVGLLNGPLIKTHEILTRPRPTAPIRNLKVAYDEKETSMKIMWEPSCGASFGPFTYRVEVTEETRNRTSRYELYSPTNDDEPSHEIVNVPIGARFNICVKPMIPHAEVKCTKFRTRALETPSGVRAWLAVNGHVMVSWEDQPARDHTGFKYQVIVSEKEIPDDILDPTEDMQTTTAEFSPVLMNIAGSMHGPLYVGVRSVTHEGYYSDLSEVQTLVMLGSAEPVSSLSSLWWGAGAALLVSVLLAGALVHAALRHRRLSRSFLRFTAAPRYDSRRGQATLTEHDDDDVPPIHGFSDDEPLVIA